VATLRAVRRARGVVEVAQEGGALLVSERVLVLLARAAARDHLAAAGTGRLRSVATAPGSVSLGIAARYGTPVGPLADAVRAHVLAALAEHAGERALVVNVEVIDVVE
jgi:uncharacterized alkaline shock family protein YloU